MVNFFLGGRRSYLRKSAKRKMLTEILSILFCSVLLWKPVSTEDWEQHFKIQESNPKKDFSIDPSLLCKPGLQDSNLADLYNGAKLNALIIKEMDISMISTALFKNGTETVYVSSAQTIVEAIDLCEKDGALYTVSSSESKFLAAVLKTTITSNLIPRVMFSITCKDSKAQTIDKANIAAKGSCDDASPYVIFSATGLTLASPSTVVPAILCRKTSVVLSENLKNFGTAIDKELLSIESSLSTLRTKLQNIFEVFVNSSELRFTTNHTAILDFIELPPANCLEVKVFVGKPLTNHSLPIIVHPDNLATASQLLRSRMDESKSIIRQLTKIFDNILSPENGQTSISVQYTIDHFSDIFDLLPFSSKEKLLSVILLGTIGLVLLICICFLAGYKVILHQGAREWVRRLVFNVQVNPPPPTSMPLIQQR